MDIQKNLIKTITALNWILMIVTTWIGFQMFGNAVGLGVLWGAGIVTINFHLLSKTLKKAFTPPHISSHHVVLAKYYIRFIISGIIIFVLISGHYVNPLGLFVGLSIVVVSIVMATMSEVFKMIFNRENVIYSASRV